VFVKQIIGPQFALSDVDVVTATIDLEDVRTHRKKSSRSMQASQAQRYYRVEVDFALSASPVYDPALPATTSSGVKGEEHVLDTDVGLASTKPLPIRYHTPEEEIAYGPACWLWDYLRRSRTQGYFVPLSGGIDSCATAVIVYSMCRLVVEAVAKGGT
jgi:NAD+ synthase (glutamine-hydrolysing)